MDLKKLAWIIAFGLILRLLIASVTFHPDVRIVNFTSAVFLQEGFFNPYEFFNRLNPDDPRKEVYRVETPDDLPLQYLIRLPLEAPIRFLVDKNIESQFLSGSSLLGNPQLFLHLLVVKFPLIIFDLLTGIILILYLPIAARKKGLLIWMLNPMSLWATAAIGQVDIMPILFMVLSLVLLKNNKIGLSALSLGIGGALKSFPYFLAPFLILSAKTWKQRIWLSALIITPALISVVPYLSSPEFRSQALFAPQIDKSLYAGIPLSGGESIFLTVAALVGLYLFYALRRQELSFSRLANGLADDFLVFITVALLLVLSFTHFHIQWFFWVVPFLIILIVRGLSSVQSLAVWAVVLALVLMLFFFEGSLQVQLFAPLFPALAGAKSLSEVLSGENVALLRNIAASIFAASSIFLSVTLLARHNHRES